MSWKWKKEAFWVSRTSHSALRWALDYNRQLNSQLGHYRVHMWQPSKDSPICNLDLFFVSCSWKTNNIFIYCIIKLKISHLSHSLGYSVVFYLVYQNETPFPSSIDKEFKETATLRNSGSRSMETDIQCHDNVSELNPTIIGVHKQNKPRQWQTQ